MRSIVAVRDKVLRDLVSALERPGLYATNGSEMDRIGRHLLSLLCFIDGHDEAFAAWLRSLHSYGKLSIGGAFTGRFGDDRAYTTEVASIVFAGAYLLDVIDVEHALNDDCWDDLVDTAVNRFEDVDVTFSEALAVLPAPSLRIGEVTHASACVGYATDDRAHPWLFLDFAAERHHEYDIDAGDDRSVQGPLFLRNLRITGRPFNESIVLTRYGRRRHYGPHSWTHQPPLKRDSRNEGIAAQLRQLEGSDPSQRRTIQNPVTDPNLPV